MKNFESITVFRGNNRSIHLNIDGITHEESLVSSEAGGNCINWILGHIIASRDDVFELLGIEKQCDEEYFNLYKRGSSNISPLKAIRLEKHLENLDNSQKILEKNIPEKDFSDNEDNLKMLAFLGFHEAYHSGQIGMLRRIIGKEGAIK